jgi:hypothetical protein
MRELPSQQEAIAIYGFKIFSISVEWFAGQSQPQQAPERSNIEGFAPEMPQMRLCLVGFSERWFDVIWSFCPEVPKAEKG